MNQSLDTRMLVICGIIVGVFGLVTLGLLVLAVVFALPYLPKRKPARPHADTDTQQMWIKWPTLGTLIAHVNHVLHTGHRYTWNTQ